MNKKIMVIILVFSIVCVGTYFYLGDDGLPKYGWKYNDDITQDGWAGYEWKVYLIHPHDMCVNCDIRVYGRAVTPSTTWSLDGVGIYNIGEKSFQWEWNNFPFDMGE